jgi:DNA-directed RNA polymerase specialized sigma24 family protein
MEDQCFSDGGFAGEDKSPLLQRNLAALSVDMSEMSMDDRHDWVEDLTDARLVRIKRALSPEEIEFLSHLVVDRLSPAELSRKLGISRAAVSKRLKRIKNKLEKITAQG